MTHCLAGLAADEPADRAEAVAELLAAAADELELAGRVELREGELVLEDGARRLPARVLRLGLALALGASEDGEVLAVAHPGTGGEWRTGLDPGTRDAVRRALEAARGRRPPGLVPLPFAADPARPSTVPRAGNGRGAAPPGGSRAPGDDP